MKSGGANSVRLMVVGAAHERYDFLSLVRMLLLVKLHVVSYSMLAKEL